MRPKNTAIDTAGSGASKRGGPERSSSSCTVRRGGQEYEYGWPHPPELLSPGGLWHGLPVQQGLCPQRPGSKEHPNV